MPVQTISARIERVREQIANACRRSGRSPEEVTIVAVTKGFPPPAIAEAAAAGIRHFGENRVQEAQDKLPRIEGLPPGITWHMIGRLQTNKVKTALNLFDIIHSVDSLHLAEAISRRATRETPVFLQVNVAGESAKSGFTPEELPAACETAHQLPQLDIRGLMTIAPLTDDPEETRPVFQRLRREAAALGLQELSMGMTNDYTVAIEEGATHVRIGRAIFGERESRP